MPKSQLIRTAVIPVAGKGRRMYPLTAAMPKEMLATSNGPIIELIVRELIESDIEHIILVTAPGKEAIRQHLNAIDLPHIPSGKKVKFTYINQNNIPGNGGAILTASAIIGNEPFIVVWGDEIFLGDKPRAKQLIDTYSSTLLPVIALTEVSPDDVGKCGIAQLGKKQASNTYQLSGLIEKPTIKNAPSRLASVGGFIITPKIIDVLKSTKVSADGEVYLSSALGHFSQENVLLGELIESSWHETGSIEGYTKAFIAVALNNTALHSKVIDTIKKSKK